MCFYDTYEMACNCFKWGHFRQHCSKEYRTGETCGMKLVMNRYAKEEKCKICIKIDTKYRNIQKEEDKIARWRQLDGRSASIEKAQDIVAQLHHDVARLCQERDEKQRSLR
ncbi:hypothetical protein BKA65DRAFT_272608 [Rhexocercosporidium sp. MPI-PUGE-AT-0058]|nr:hypothetical protein BKA65DRAFT_272608 [Rhexocercosporidium sp. MPI-PUGE-AT-0058]